MFQVFAKFWFFTFVYASKYDSPVPLSLAAPLFMENFLVVVDGFFVIWVLAALGAVTLFLHLGLRSKRVLVSLFTLCSFLTVCPGFYFR